jgi:multidrug resistance efflux pump
MSNTPESDDHHQYYKIGLYTLDFARKLERKRDEALNAFIMTVDEMVQAQSQLREAKRELDEAREETVRTLNFMDHGFATAQKELTSVTEQRDKLAAVLQKIRDGYGGQLAAPNCCEDCDFLLPIDEALQSLTTTEP